MTLSDDDAKKLAKAIEYQRGKNYTIGCLTALVILVALSLIIIYA